MGCVTDLESGPGARKGKSNGDHQGRQKLRVLMVEDDPSDIELSQHALRQGGFDCECAAAQTREEFTEHVRQAIYDVVLADYNLPMWNGMETIGVLREEGLDVPVIVVSGYLGELKAVECIKQGAADYVLKDHLLHLPISVKRALQEKKLREEYGRTLEDLARSNRDLEQFAYVASHDLQEPLRMVAIYTQLLAERYQGKLDPEADKYIHYAVDGATRMQTLVQDLLAFSRVGRQDTEFKRTDCAAIAEERAEESAQSHSGQRRADRMRIPAMGHGGFNPDDTAFPEPDRKCDQVSRTPSRRWCGSQPKKRSRKSSSRWPITASASHPSMPMSSL